MTLSKLSECSSETDSFFQTVLKTNKNRVIDRSLLTKRQHLQLLSIPRPIPKPPPLPKRKVKQCHIPQICPERIDQLSIPKSVYILDVLEKFTQTLEPERVVRLVKLVHAENEDDRRRCRRKKRKRKKRLRRKKPTVEECIRIWLKKRIQLTTQLIIKHIKHRDTKLTPNYKQLLVAIGFMKCLNVKKKRITMKHTKEYLMHICEQLAIECDLECKPFEMEVEPIVVEPTESEEEIKKHIIWVMTTPPETDEEVEEEEVGEEEEEKPAVKPLEAEEEEEEEVRVYEEEEYEGIVEGMGPIPEVAEEDEGEVEDKPLIGGEEEEVLPEEEPPPKEEGELEEEAPPGEEPLVEAEEAVLADEEIAEEEIPLAEEPVPGGAQMGAEGEDMGLFEEMVIGEELEEEYVRFLEGEEAWMEEPVEEEEELVIVPSEVPPIEEAPKPPSEEVIRVPTMEVLHEHPPGTISYLAWKVYSSWLEEFSNNINTYGKCLRNFREIMEMKAMNYGDRVKIETIIINWGTYLKDSLDFEQKISENFKGKPITKCEKCGDYTLYNIPYDHEIPEELKTAAESTARWRKLLLEAEQLCLSFMADDVSILSHESIFILDREETESSSTVSEYSVVELCVVCKAEEEPVVPVAKKKPKGGKGKGKAKPKGKK